MSDELCGLIGWVTPYLVVVTDHWSGIAAFLLFSTQLWINIRSLYKGRAKRKQKDGPAE